MIIILKIKYKLRNNTYEEKCKIHILIRAQKAMRLLNELIRGENNENNVILPVKLVERESVTPLN